MPRRSVPVALPTVIVVGLLGLWAGSGVSAVPPAPTVSVPTVTVPPLPLPPPAPLPVPVPPPPTVTVPPKVEPPPLPPAAPTPVDIPAVPRAETSPAPPPAPRGGAASSAFWVGRATVKRPARRSPAGAPSAERKAATPIARGPEVKGVSASVQGDVPEDGGFLGPITAALGTVDTPAEAIPGALFAMAVLAVCLLAVASMPFPARSSPAGAMLVHKRGSIAAAGLAAFVMAVATYFLL